MASVGKLGRLVARNRIRYTTAAFPPNRVDPDTTNNNEYTLDIVTKHSARNSFTESADSSFFVLTPETELVDNLLHRTQRLMNPSSSNVIAFSGGVDSSLAAALVYKAFTGHTHGNSSSSSGGSVTAVLGLSPAVPPEQIDTARSVAATIGVNLQEVRTEEGSDPVYLANKGQACLACKNHLYSTLNAVAAAASSFGEKMHERRVILYNGTNADDIKDPTRLGLVAASNFRVESPLLHTTKSDVRRAAKHVGLPNWNHAAAPCLRSRLAFGVEATRRHLEVVGEAERRVRKALSLDQSVNMRVRYLAGRRAMVEIDEGVLHDTKAETVLQREGFDEVFSALGFKSYGVRAFKSGSVAAVLRSYGASKRNS